MITSFRQMLLDKAENNARRRIDQVVDELSWSCGIQCSMEIANKKLREIEIEYYDVVEFIMQNYNEES